MKFLRFQGYIPNTGTSNKLGIFQIAYQLKNSPHISRQHDQILRKNLEWLEQHLSAPTVLESSGNHRAICWFKDTASAPLNQIWSIKSILEEYGYLIDLVKTSEPGVIIYEDGWQVAAKPFRDKRRYF